MLLTASLIGDITDIITSIVYDGFDIVANLFLTIYDYINYLAGVLDAMPTVLRFGFGTFLSVAVGLWILDFVKSVIL